MTSTQLLVVVLASATGAMVKSVTGMGYPVITVPLVALAAGVPEAVMIVAIPNLGANLYMCWETRDGRVGARDLPRLLGFGVVGAIVGTVALVRLPNEPLMLLLAATILVFLVQFVRRPDLHIDVLTSHRWSPLAGFVAGCMQGAIGVSAPVVATWMHGYKLAVRTYIYSVTAIFAVTGLVQLVILLTKGEMTLDLFVATALASVTVSLVLPVGVRLRNRLAGEVFNRLVLAVILLSAISLIVDVVT